MGGKNWGDYVAGFVFAAVVGAIVSGAAIGLILWVDASWQECRRVHPAWYCAVSR